MVLRRAILFTLAGVLWAGAASPVAADPRRDARTWVSFGIEVAQRGLWREAIYRWQRATEIDPSYAPAFNNLGIGYEHEGELEKAREAYEKALALAPKDQQIRQNYELFKELNERVTKPPKEQP
jgi:type IV pilus assembly protein PilF